METATLLLLIYVAVVASVCMGLLLMVATVLVKLAEFVAPPEEAPQEQRPDALGNRSTYADDFMAGRNWDGMPREIKNWDGMPKLPE